jgi:hypothetical protein
MNLEQQRALVIAQAYGAQNDIEKSSKANVGEVRDWGGKKYQKQANGDWKEVVQNTKDKSKSILSNPDGEGTVVDKEGQHFDYRVYKDGGVKIEGYNLNKHFSSKKEAQDFLTKQGFKEMLTKSEAYDILGIDSLEKGEDPCWEGYEQFGMKEKGGRKVPNCVPVKKGEDFSEDEELKKSEETPKNGDMKRSTREGKKAMVYMDGTWHHFGDSDSKHNYSESARERAKSRHAKNLEGDDPRAKAFRVYWKKYWTEGGSVKKGEEMSKSEAYDILGITDSSDLGELLEKGKEANIGEVRVWANGKKKQKQADGSWKTIERPKKGGTKGKAEEEAPKKSGKFNEGDTWEWHSKTEGVKKVKIVDIKENGDIVGQFEGSSDRKIIREPNKYLKNKAEGGKKETQGSNESGLVGKKLNVFGDGVVEILAEGNREDLHKKYGLKIPANPMGYNIPQEGNFAVKDKDGNIKILSPSFGKEAKKLFEGKSEVKGELKKVKSTGELNLGDEVVFKYGGGEGFKGKVLEKFNDDEQGILIQFESPIIVSGLKTDTYEIYDGDKELKDLYYSSGSKGSDSNKKKEEKKEEENNKPKNIEESFSQIVDFLNSKYEEVLTYGPKESKYNPNRIESEIGLKIKTKDGYEKPYFKMSFSKSTGQTEIFVPDFYDNTNHKPYQYFDGFPSREEVVKMLKQTDFRKYLK